MAAENDKIVYGGSMMLFIGTGSTLTPLAFATSAKFDLTLDIREISSKDSGIWKEKAAGKWDSKASADGLTSFGLTGNTNGIDELFTLMIAREPVNMSFAIASGSTPNWSPDLAETYLSGQMIISSLNLTANDNDTSTYSITLEGASAISMTVPVPPPPAVIPVFGGADANATNTILISFDIAMADPSAHLADFSVSVNSANVSLTSVALDTDTTKLLLTLATSMITGDTVTLSIVSGNIQSSTGGLLAELVDEPVTLGFVVVIKPVVSLAACNDPNKVLVVFNTHLEDPSSNMGMFDLYVGGMPIEITGVTLNPIADTGVVIATSETLVTGNIITFSLDAGAVRSTSTGLNDEVLNHAVTNML